MYVILNVISSIRQVSAFVAGYCTNCCKQRRSCSTDRERYEVTMSWAGASAGRGGVVVWDVTDTVGCTTDGYTERETIFRAKAAGQTWRYWRNGRLNTTIFTGRAASLLWRVTWLAYILQRDTGEIVDVRRAVLHREWTGLDGYVQTISDNELTAAWLLPNPLTTDLQP